MTTATKIKTPTKSLLAGLVLFSALVFSASAAVPIAPASPSASATLEAQIALSWAASSGATSYDIYRGTSSGGETLLQSNVTRTTFEDTGLNSGQTYYYEVTAVNSSGQSGKSTEVSAVTLAPAPTNFVATAGDSQVVLTWTAAATATGYRIFRDTLGGAGGATNVVATGTSYTDTGLINGTAYYYGIIPINVSGEDRSVGAIATATPKSGSGTEAPAGAPTNVTATAGNAQIVLNWLPVSNATSYQVFRGTSSTMVTTSLGSVTTTTYTDTGVTNGTPYYYLVKAVNTNGQTSSSVVTATPSVPSAPANLTATAGSGRVVLNWTATGTNYAIYRGIVSGSETLLNSGLTGSTFTDAGVTNGTTYFYKVQGLNAGGSGLLSSEVSATPSGSTPQSWSGTVSFGLTGEPVQSCTAYIPDITRPVQAAFFVAQGSNLPSQPSLPNLFAIATKYNAITFNLDGFTQFNFGTAASPIYLSTANDTSHNVCIMDYRWPQRSAQRIQAALTAAAQLVPTRPEIANTGLVMYGFSEGTDNVNLTIAQSALVNRVLGMVNLSELDEDSSNPLVTMDTAPHLFLSSGLSDPYSTLNQVLSDFQPLSGFSVTYDVYARGLSTNQGAPLTVLDNVGVGHGQNTDHPFTSIWLDSVLSQRLPATIPTSSPVSLPSWQNSSSWVGTYTVSTSTSSPWGSSGSPGVRMISNVASARSSYTDTRPFTWLPSQNTAQTWLTYANTGSMSAFTPVITSPSTATGTTGSSFRYQITAINDPTSYNATSLPNGLSVNASTGVISGTLNSTGTITLSASNAEGAGTGSLTINTASPVTFSQWETGYGINSSPTATPEHDGITNLQKYLFDINPSHPMSATDRAALPTFGSTISGGTEYLTLTYRQFISVTGITINVLISPDMKNWTPLTKSQTVTSTTYTLQQVGTSGSDPVMQVQAPITGTREFIRLNVTQP